MMRLSTMLRVDRTIDDAGSSPIAERIVSAWPHDAGSLGFVRSSANVIYAFSHGDAEYVLRFADDAERGVGELAAEAALMTWLANRGVPTPSPLPSLQGRAVETITTSLGTFHALALPILNGTVLDLDGFDQPRARAWGEAMGRLHAALDACPPDLAAQWPTWRDQLERLRPLLHDRPDAVRAELDGVAALLGALPEEPGSFGLIHGDFEPDNLVWQGSSVQLFDFDACARGWRLADAAFALRDRFAAGTGAEDPIVGAFLDGCAATGPAGAYDATGPLSHFVRWANLLTYGSIVRALDLDEDAGHPDWMNGLVARLRDRMEDYEHSLSAEAP